MKHKLSVMRLLGIVVAAGLLVSACAPVATAPTSAPTAVPPTATTAPTATAVATATVEPTQAIVSVGTDIKQTLPAGDAARGSDLVKTLENCTECHEGDEAPMWEAGPRDDNVGIGTRAETRYKAADYTGHATNAQQYLFESIVLPSAYIIKHVAYEISPGKSAMPGFASQLTAQNMADIIAYLETLK